MAGIVRARSIWSESFAKYTHVAFDSRKEKESGCDHLFVVEPYAVLASNWRFEIINSFKTYITWNKKFVEVNEGSFKKNLKIIIFEGGPLTDNIPDTSLLDVFTPYDEKMKKTVTIGKDGHRMRLGNIYFLRGEFIEKFAECSSFDTHLFSSTPFGGKHYQGVNDGGPWGKNAIEIIDKYRFYFCPDNSYHPMWSYGYLGENIIRAFKAKTVPIYIGCYNVEDYIPKDLFIDFRDFYVPGMTGNDVKSEEYSPYNSRTNYKAFAEYLENFPKEKYIEMTEKAYEWQRKRGTSVHDRFVELMESLK